MKEPVVFVRANMIKLFLGISLLVVGGGFLLQQFGVWDFGYVFSRWWPILIVGVGVIQLLTKSLSIIASSIVILVGALLLFNRLALFTVNFWGVFWALILILLGVWILFSRMRVGADQSSRNDYIQVFALFSGPSPKVFSEHFKGGFAAAMFGGADIDLTEAKLDEKGAVLDVFVAFGGVNIYVPKGWKAHVAGLPLFGGWDNKTRKTEASDPNQPPFTVRALVLFGGMDIRER